MTHLALQRSPAAVSAARLRRLCTFVRVLVVLGALVALTVPGWLWSSPDWVRAQAQRLPEMAGKPMTLDARALWLFALVHVPSLLVDLFLLWQLWRLFGEYGRGDVFSRRALGHLRRFSMGVLVSGALAPVTQTAAALAVTLGNPPGQRQLIIALSSDDYTRLLVGAVLVAITSVMAQAVRVAEENAEFV